MTELTCEFCGYATTNKSNLIRHQTKTIYCLNMQENKKVIKNDVIIPKKEMIKTRKELELELKYKDDIIHRLEDQIKDLKNEVSKERQNQQHITLAAVTKPTTQVKNTIKNCVVQNLNPLLESEMKDQIKFLTIDHIKSGPEGYAKYALEYPLKDKFTCTDVSRKKLAWKDSTGNIIYDNEGSQLSEKFFRILTERNLQLFREILNDLDDRLDSAYKREDHVEAEAIVELTGKICTWRTQAVRTGKGDDTDLKNDFVKYLCIAEKKVS